MALQRKQYGIEDARRFLPQIVDDALSGQTTIVTRHGKACAAIVPLDVVERTAPPTLDFEALRGTGRGLWGDDPAATIARDRDEW